MRLSIVIVTHNRRAALARTLKHLDALACDGHLPSGGTEVIVVDNGSTDGTWQEAARSAQDVRVIRRPRNEGVSARNHAFTVALGEYLLLIDDDSYPLGDAVMRSLEHLDAQVQCAAVVGRIELPDGTPEASALPTVVANGAVVLRKAVIDRVGGFPREFFRQAEEYDLSFRIWNAGFRIDRFEDLVYRHEKVGGNRAMPIIHRMDMRNNLILADRYLPGPWRRKYASDWAMRYLALARHAGMAAAAHRGRISSWVWRGRDRLAPRRHLSGPAMEAIFGLRSQADRIAWWASKHRVRRVVIADFSKNIRATLEGCRACGLDVLAVADRHPAFSGRRWEGAPILTDESALRLNPEGVVLSNVSPARVEARLGELRRAWPIPVLGLWEPATLGARDPAWSAGSRDAA